MPLDVLYRATLPWKLFPEVAEVSVNIQIRQAPVSSGSGLETVQIFNNRIQLAIFLQVFPKALLQVLQLLFLLLFGTFGSVAIFTADQHQLFLLFNYFIFCIAVAALNDVLAPHLAFMCISMIGTAKVSFNATFPTQTRLIKRYVSFCAHDFNLFDQSFLASKK